MCQIKNMKSYSSPSPSPSKIINPLKRSHAMTSSSSPSVGRGACASSTVAPKKINVEKQKEPECHRDEGFDDADDNDDGISIEEAMALIDEKEVEEAMNCDTSATDVKTISKTGDDPSIKKEGNGDAN